MSHLRIDARSFAEALSVWEETLRQMVLHRPTLSVKSQRPINSMNRPIYRIADKPPEFPCWLWRETWHEWCKYACPPLSDGFTHWSPDAPTPPEEVPTETNKTHAYGFGVWAATANQAVSMDAIGCKPTLGGDETMAPPYRNDGPGQLTPPSVPSNPAPGAQGAPAFKCTKPICKNGCMFPQDCPEDRVSSQAAQSPLDALAEAVDKAGLYDRVDPETLTPQGGTPLTDAEDIWDRAFDAYCNGHDEHATAHERGMSVIANAISSIEARLRQREAELAEVRRVADTMLDYWRRRAGDATADRDALRAENERIRTERDGFLAAIVQVAKECRYDKDGLLLPPDGWIRARLAEAEKDRERLLAVYRAAVTVVYHCKALAREQNITITGVTALDHAMAAIEPDAARAKEGRT